MGDLVESLMEDFRKEKPCMVEGYEGRAIYDHIEQQDKRIEELEAENKALKYSLSPKGKSALPKLGRLYQRIEDLEDKIRCLSHQTGKRQ